MADIVEAVSPVEGLPYYQVTDTELGPGASFGSGHAWINTGTDGRIHSLFSTDVGEEVAGPLIVRYASAETRVGGAGRTGLRRADVPLMPVGAGRFLIHPFHQQHAFSLPGAIEVEETVFVPRVPVGHAGDETVAYYAVSLRNASDRRRRLSIYAFARLRRQPAHARHLGRVRRGALRPVRLGGGATRTGCAR